MDPQTAYPVAGSFVGHLIRTEGLGKVADFFRGCRQGGGDRDQAFAGVFGRSLEAAGAEWLAGL
jgi:hypothetical protein